MHDAGTDIYDAGPEHKLIASVPYEWNAGMIFIPADTQAKPLDESFRRWGRAGPDFKTGIYTFETVKPGPVDTRRGKLEELAGKEPV